MEQRDGSFFDPKTILAIIMVGGVWFAWQTYLTKKYPGYGKPVAVNSASVEAKVGEATGPLPGAAGSGPDTSAGQKQLGESSVQVVDGTVSKEKLVGFENDVFSMQISSHGMGLKSLTLKKFKNREHLPVQLGVSKAAGLFELRFNDQVVDFDISPMVSDKGESTFVGTAKVGNMTLKRSLVFGGSYVVRSEFTLENASGDFKSFQVLIPEVANNAGPGSIFSPATETQEFVYGTTKNFERLNTQGSDPIDKAVGLFDIFGVASHYFVTGFANESEIVPEISLHGKPGEIEVTAGARYKPSNVSAAMTFASRLFAGPKDLETLQAASTSQTDLTPIVNFGFFGMIGKILLKVLQFFYNFTIPNWGVAIILLTLLVRLLVLPFNIASYKSMKKMQVIQPQIASLRERYKDDATTLNTEMMKLMKDQKVNPLGGCLPMFLQMPVFFALYQVLGQSVDLYQAPFFGWIQDLSLKDPLFVLPVLMGIAMWYNQKITPSTMDPTQAKVMQFLPLVFSFMMIALPSGLTLYIFVSTLFGIIQQQIFLKDRSTQAKAV